MRRAALTLVALLALPLAARAQDTAASAPPPAPPTGLHMVFDASASMCGYLRGAEAKQTATMLTLIRFATTQRDTERNDRVVLIQQRGDKPSAADLIEAPPDFQALAAKGRTGTGCAPFDGRDSNPVVAFETPPFAARPRSLILVSDMQFEERALVAFVDRFRQHARAQTGPEPYSVGFATLAAPFAGPYYAVNETNRELRRSGYALPPHNRPLHLLWFLVGTRDLDTGRRLFDELGLLARPRAPALLYGLRLMPLPRLDPAQWFDPVPVPRSAAELFGPPQHAVDKPKDSPRTGGILELCVNQRWDAGALAVKADNPCRDGKRLFDGTVNAVRMTLPLSKAHGLGVVPGGTAAALKGGALELVLNRDAPPEQSIPLALAVPAPVLDKELLRKLSLDNDACSTAAVARPASGPASSWQDQCAARLAGRTYRYDAFVEQLAMRTHGVLEERAAAANVVLRVRFQHR